MNCSQGLHISSESLFTKAAIINTASFLHSAI
jgi:hypothetical protein